MDAAALTRAVLEHNDLPTALANYSAARRSHVRFYQWATRWCTPFFQSDLLPLGWL
jgi:2-polyprenyl-6-methoxyphenol hydroxylase-like FAD-dependent oxidoreductase